MSDERAVSVWEKYAQERTYNLYASEVYTLIEAWKKDEEDIRKNLEIYQRMITEEMNKLQEYLGIVEKK
jgi:hypothetical protein